MVGSLVLSMTEVSPLKYVIWVLVQFMVGGLSGLTGHHAIHLVELVQEQDTGSATILPLNMEGTSATVQ